MLEQLKQFDFPVSSIFDNKKIAIVVPIFDRPEYFKECIKHLSKCDEIQEISLFFYLDGGKKSKYEEHVKIIKNINHKNKFLIKRNVNFGCEKNILSCFHDIFEELNFDFMFLIEDDILVGKKYFQSCYEKFKDIKNNIDNNIGIFQGHSLCFMNPEEKKQNINSYEFSNDLHHWGILISKEAYKKIKLKLIDYENLIFSLPNDGNSKIHILQNKIKINTFFDKIIESSEQELSEKIRKDYYKKQNSHSTLGWDGAFLIALLSAGMRRYNFKVNRLINIGKNGDHFNDHQYNAMNLHKISLDEVW